MESGEDNTTEYLTAVIEAARKGWILGVNILIENGYRVDVSDERGWRPTHHAAYGGHLECLKVLLEHEGTDIDHYSYDGLTSLIVAIQAGHPEAVRMLLQHKAEPDLADFSGNSPTMTATMKGDRECITILLEYGPDVNKKNSTDNTPLHIAISKGHTDIATKLLEYRASLDVVDDYDKTPIMLAAYNGRTEVLKFLLEAAEKRDQLPVIDAQAKDGTTAVFLAAQEGKEDCLRLLLQYGASANIVTKDMHGLPPPSLPLHIALEFKHIPCVRLLMPVTNQQQLPSCQHSPWELALDDISGKSAQCLVNHGFDVNYSHSQSTECDMTPLALLSGKQMTCTKIAELLLKAGADVNTTSPRQIHPFLVALTNHNTKLIHLFIEHGSDINIYRPHTNVNQTIAICIQESIWGELMVMLKCGAEVKSVLTGCRYWRPMTSPCDNYYVHSHLLNTCSMDQNQEYDWDQVILLFLHFVANVRLHPILEEVFGCVPEWQPRWKHIVQIAEQIPRRLQHLCRLVIRDQFTPKQLFLETDLRNLLLPDPLKDYLRYKDIFVNSPLRENGNE